jgi:hypothetical protein
LGTFGSNVDDTAEQEAFETAGLGNVWGYSSNEGSFRSDSSIAHILAERGYLGLALFALALVPLLIAAVQLSGGEWLTVAGPVAAIALSPLAATFNSAPMMLILVFPPALAARSILPGTVAVSDSTGLAGAVTASSLPPFASPPHFLTGAQ